MKNVEQGRSWGHVFDKHLIPFVLYIISQHKPFVWVPKFCKIFQIQCFIEYIRVNISSLIIGIMFIKQANVVVFLHWEKGFMCVCVNLIQQIFIDFITMRRSWICILKFYFKKIMSFSTFFFILSKERKPWWLVAFWIPLCPLLYIPPFSKYNSTK